jgi:hypothetical protein
MTMSSTAPNGFALGAALKKQHAAPVTPICLRSV